MAQVKDGDVNVTVVLPRSMVKWLDENAAKNDLNRSQVVRAKLRIAKQVEDNAPLLSKSKKTK